MTGEELKNFLSSKYDFDSLSLESRIEVLFNVILSMENQKQEDMKISKIKLESSSTQIKHLRNELFLMNCKNKELTNEKNDIQEKLTNQITTLQSKLVESQKRLRKYDNPNVPSDSIYNNERKKFRKTLNESRPESHIDNSKVNSSDESTSKRGPPKGCKGTSHNNKADRTIRIPVTKCEKCNGNIKKLPTTLFMMYEFIGNTKKMENIAYFLERGYCKKCTHTTKAPRPTLPGTAFGEKALGTIYEYYQEGSTDQSIAYFFKSLYGFVTSPNAIWNARKALKNLLIKPYAQIKDHLAKAPFVNIDETPFKIDGRQGYVWLATTNDSTYLVTAASRARLILQHHFGFLLDKPIVVDGYVAYDTCSIRQRCWIHLLRDSEEYAIKIGKLDLVLHKRLRAIYHSIKHRTSATSSECLELQKMVLDIAYSYPKGHKFRTTLENASPYMFTFLRHPGMPPHNNSAELEIRNTIVRQRNVRHQLTTSEGMEVFSILLSVARTCLKNEIFPHQAITNLINDPSWNILKPPDKMAITA